MPPISIMVKPSSSHCNLECKYCFYHSLSSQRKKYAYDFMDEELMGNIIKKACEFTRGDRIYLSFQGGEPLLIGKKFFINHYPNLYNYIIFIIVLLI